MSVTGGSFSGASNTYKKLQVDQELVLNGKLTLARDWTPFVPVLLTGALGTGLTNRWRYRIVGRTVEIKVTVATNAAGTIGSGAYQFRLPTGCIAADQSQCGGTATLFGATNSYLCSVFMAGSTAFSLYLSDPTTSPAALAVWGSTSAADVRLSATTLGFQLSATFELDPSSPILAAGSNQ